MDYKVGDKGSFRFDDCTMNVLIISVDEEESLVTFITEDGFADDFVIDGEYEDRFILLGTNVFLNW